MTNLAHIRSLSFDTYGTLIDWESGIAAALRPWASRHQVSLTDEELIALFAVHETRVQQERPFRQYPEVLAETMRRLGAELDRPVTEVEAYAFGRSVGCWAPFDDTVESLQRLAPQFDLIIVSNIDDVSFRQSNDLLHVEFDAIISAEGVGSYKPAPRHFETLADTLIERGLERAEHLHVAQSLYHDHVPAMQHGFTTCWIDRRHDRVGYGATPKAASVEPDLRFPNLRDFTDAILSAHDDHAGTEENS